MRRWLIELLKSETILIVASILALVSCFIVPPDAGYKDYVHMSTISQLSCLMLVVCGFQRIGVFRIIGSRLLHHVNTARGLVITLIAMTYFRDAHHQRRGARHVRPVRDRRAHHGEHGG
jgi:di/tricarboxylate transporter